MPDAPKVETKVNLIVSRSCQNHRGEKGRGEIGGVHLPSQLVQHNFLLVMVDRVKGELAYIPRPHQAAWAEFTIMMECTPESGHCQSICNLSSVTKTTA
jgi:hypothetical protein